MGKQLIYTHAHKLLFRMKLLEDRMQLHKWERQGETVHTCTCVYRNIVAQIKSGLEQGTPLNIVEGLCNT